MVLDAPVANEPSANPCERFTGRNQATTDQLRQRCGSCEAAINETQESIPAPLHGLRARLHMGRHRIASATRDV